MPHWLCDAREGQAETVLHRFDPRYWTVDFARPDMAAVVATAHDALRVDAVFHRRESLVGLIWESADRWSHPLLAFRTDRDYRRTHLHFRWRSGGVIALDAVNGPTLTVEGRDAAGAPFTAYVRLWNYAEGSPEDAVIRLPFSTLKAGFNLAEQALPFHVGDVDRMFVSLVPPGYDPAAPGPLAAAAEGWAELSAIFCEGEHGALRVGDALVPGHRLSLATAYDDTYNLTPQRLLGEARALGYAGPLLHYVGMSHFPALAAGGGQVAPAGDPLAAPARAWHRAFLAEAKAAGFSPILSLSYELFDAWCPDGWKQRASDGSPALTGWDPPSTLLSPASAPAMAWLQAAGRAFAGMMAEAGVPVRFQIGEPWWWVTQDRRLCLHDAAAEAALGSAGLAIDDVRAPLSAAQTALLDRAGALLAASTAALAGAVRAEAAARGVTAELLLLVYLPAVLDALAPELRRANVPAGWARPAFDILQCEDYDWASAGDLGRSAAGVTAMAARLGYPVQDQHYLAGFVRSPADRAQWRAIDAAADAALARGSAATFIWAAPQVARDGYVRFESAEGEAMQPFDDVLFPVALGREAVAGASFATRIATTLSGAERRNAGWADARLSYDVAPGVRSEADLAALLGFFRARLGAARGFRLTDPVDNSSAGLTGAPGAFDQLIGIGDGSRTRFPLLKAYGEPPQRRRITRPVAGSVTVSVGGVPSPAFLLEPLGIVVLAAAPPAGVEVRAGYRFDVPVRFAEDRLDLTRATEGAFDLGPVPLLMLREGEEDA